MVAERLVAVLLFVLALGAGLPGPVAGHPAAAAVYPAAAVRQVATGAPAEVAPSTVDTPASPAPAASWRNAAGPLLLALAGGLLATVLAVRTTRRARRA